jgi:hypothetical protein
MIQEKASHMDEQLSSNPSIVEGAISVQEPESSGAPIEIKKKESLVEQTENKANPPIEVVKGDASIVKEEREKAQKLALKMTITRLFRQMKQGCDKDLCFQKHCRKNPFEYAQFKALSENHD